MEATKIFPEIIVNEHARGFEGLVGLKLKSILKGDLLLQQAVTGDGKPSTNNPLDPENRHKTREAFLHAISTWLSSVTLELHIAALPDLLDRSNGNLWVSLFLRHITENAERVKEELISRYLSLMPILFSHFPETEFVPIVDVKELASRYKPFHADRAVAIKRRVETISLLAPLKRLSLGFGPIREKDDDVSYQVHHRFPWVPSSNDGSKLIGTLMAQLDPVHIIVRIKTTKSGSKAVARLEETIRICDLFLSGSKDNQNTLVRQAGSIRDVSLLQLVRLRSLSFKLGVFLLTPGKNNSSLGNVLGATVTGSHSGIDEKNPYRAGFSCTKIKAEKVADSRYFPEKESFTLSETAGAFCLPSPVLEECSGLPVKRSRTSLAQIQQKWSSGKDAIELFLNEHQGMLKRVSMGLEDRMRHMFIIGQTGTGKSTLMENMILQDIRAGRGLAVLDPHGEMIDSIIGKIPGRRIDDVVLLDLLDRERPLGFNLIQWDTIEERDLIVDEIYMTIDRLYDMRVTGGPIFETNFRGMLRLLMGDKPRDGFVPTIIEFSQCYLEKNFRKWLVESVEDPQIQDFIKELERTCDDARLENISPYITSKFSRFTSDTTLRRIIGQEKTSFDFEEIMNQGKILFVKLGKGRFGSTISALLANHLVSRFKLAAMKRAEMDYEKRRDFFLYVDECHNLPSENFMELLAEARKYRMGLVLATQYSAQLTSSTTSIENTLLAAILGNVGAIIIFRLGQEDAVKIAPVLQPYFSSLDTIGLPNWQGFARIQMNNEASPPFSFRTEKDEIAFDRNLSSKIVTASRLKYGVDCKTVDLQINRRRNIWKKSEMKPLGAMYK